MPAACQTCAGFIPFKFFKGFLITLQLQEISDDELWELIFSNYRMMYEIYQTDKLLIPDGHLVELKYEDLTDDPGSVLKMLQKEKWFFLIPCLQPVVLHQLQLVF